MGILSFANQYTVYYQYMSIFLEIDDKLLFLVTAFAYVCNFANIKRKGLYKNKVTINLRTIICERHMRLRNEYVTPNTSPTLKEAPVVEKLKRESFVSVWTCQEKRGKACGEKSDGNEH